MVRRGPPVVLHVVVAAMTEAATAYREVQMTLQEKESLWWVGVYLIPRYIHPGGSIDPLLPQTHFRLRFRNREGTEDGFSCASVVPDEPYTRDIPSYTEAHMPLGLYLVKWTATRM